MLLITFKIPPHPHSHSWWEETDARQQISITYRAKDLLFSDYYVKEIPFSVPTHEGVPCCWSQNQITVPPVLYREWLAKLSTGKNGIFFKGEWTGRWHSRRNHELSYQQHLNTFQIMFNLLEAFQPIWGKS